MLKHCLHLQLLLLETQRQQSLDSFAFLRSAAFVVCVLRGRLRGVKSYSYRYFYYKQKEQKIRYVCYLVVFHSISSQLTFCFHRTSWSWLMLLLYCVIVCWQTKLYKPQTLHTVAVYDTIVTSANQLLVMSNPRSQQSLTASHSDSATQHHPPANAATRTDAGLFRRQVFPNSLHVLMLVILQHQIWRSSSHSTVGSFSTNTGYWWHCEGHPTNTNSLCVIITVTTINVSRMNFQFFNFISFHYEQSKARLFLFANCCCSAGGLLNVAEGRRDTSRWNGWSWCTVQSIRCLPTKVSATYRMLVMFLHGCSSC